MKALTFKEMLFGKILVPVKSHDFDSYMFASLTDSALLFIHSINSCSSDPDISIILSNIIS